MSLGGAIGIDLAGSRAAGASTTAAGYWLVARDGGVFSYGRAPFHGSTGNMHLNQPIVSMAGRSAGDGYWFVAGDGGVFAFDAPFFGSTGGIRLNQPVVGMSGTGSGQGYWLVARDGGIFAFGDASFFGSTGGMVLNQPIVAMATTPSGDGYWLVARDGGVFAFGDAGFFGSTGGRGLAQPIVAMATSPSGHGYWLLGRDGAVFAFGDARNFGAGSTSSAVAIAPTSTGGGYWVTSENGAVQAFGDAVFYGAASGTRLNQPVVGMASVAAPAGADSSVTSNNQTKPVVVAGDDAIMTVPATPSLPPAPSADVRTVPAGIPADCSADVTGALMSWIASVPDHVTLSFQPDGCYRLDGTIRLDGRNGLTLEGNGASFRAGTDGGDERRQFWFVACNDLTVRNVIVHGANPNAGVSEAAWSPAHEWQHAFALNGVQRALLDGVQAYDVYGDFVYLGPTYSGLGHPYVWSTDITVRNSHFERNGRQGFAITGARNVLITNNYMSDVRWDMFDLELNDDVDVASNISIIGNTTGIGRLLWLGASGAEGSVDHIYIAGNNMVDESATPVVYVTGPAAVRGPFLVENNHFIIHHTTSPVSCNSCSGAVVRDNVFDFNRDDHTITYVSPDSGPVSVHDNVTNRA